MDELRKVSFAAKLDSFTEHWSPRTVAVMNGLDVMVAKVQGQFVWHKHDDADDCFIVLKGSLEIGLRDGPALEERTVTLGPGEMLVVPRGVEHRPVAREEVEMILIEPTGTPNTGDPATAVKRQMI